MVATHSQSCTPSAGGSAGQSVSNGRSKRRPSYHKSSEKYSISTSSAYHRAGPSNTNNRNQQKRRSRSVCAGAPQSQHIDNRRPSAPVMSNIPRLSIANRFMSPSLSHFDSDPDSNNMSEIMINETLPTITTKSPESQTSSSFDISTTESLGRLSVAERFMNKDNSSSSLSLSIHAQQSEKRSISSLSSGAFHVTAASPFSDNVSGRLTIAETFMKTPSTTLHEGPYLTSTRSPSIFSDYDRSSPTPESIKAHPLETNNTRQNPFDDPHGFNLNPYFKPSLDSTPDVERPKRPWGSQDTLVQQNSEKKKPIYAQFVDLEINPANSDARSLSSKDYFMDIAPGYNASADELYANHGNENEYEHCADMEAGYERSDKYHYSEEGDYESEADDKGRKHEESDSKKAKRQPKKQPQADLQNNEEHDSSTGIWMGCCLVSCGQRSDRQAIQKQLQAQDNRPKNGGCGRRIWVICVFFFLIAAVVAIGCIWPRTPLMRIDGASLTTPPKISETRQSATVGNVAFESDWLVNITVDNRQNHVPTRLTQVQVVTKDALTGLLIGKGLHNDDSNLGPIVLPPNAITTIQIPIHIDYQARDSTDTTFLDLIKSCSPKHSLNLNDPMLSVGQHEALPLHFWITLHFFGLDWLKYNPTVIATPATGGFVCPQ